MTSTNVFFYTYFKSTYEHLSAVKYELFVADSGSGLHAGLVEWQWRQSRKVWLARRYLLVSQGL